jgi:hypothetical protein
MQMPPTETIPTLPDDTNPGPVPPMGPSPTQPDNEDSPLPGDDPGDDPAVPPGQSPFPDSIEPQTDHPQSL